MLKKLYSANVLSKAEKVATKIAVAKTGTAVYAAVFKGKRDTHHYAVQLCHSSLQYPILKKVELIVTGLWSKKPDHCDCIGKGAVSRIKLGDEQFITIIKKYYSWLIYDSIWRDVFADDQLDNIMERHAFFVRTDMCDNLVFQACCATRAMWERSRRMLVWSKMVELGINPAVAYIFCPYFLEIDTEDFPNKEYQYLYYRGWDGHWPLPVANFDVRKIAQFRKGDRTDLYIDRRDYNKSGTYMSVNSYWEARYDSIWLLSKYMEKIITDQVQLDTPLLDINDFKKKKNWGNMQGEFTAESMVATVNLVMEHIRNDEKKI